MNAVPFLTAARRLRLPVVAHVASWDHTVGKGVISPHCDLYVVQNRVMEDDLRRYHGISPERIRVSGWPQTDLFHRIRPRAEYDALLRRYGLDPGAPPRRRRRQHAEQRALRGAVRRASRRVVGPHLARTPPASVPAPPAGHPLAGALRGRSGARGHRGAGGELRRHRGPRDAAPARRRRRLQRGDDPARRARGRPAGRLRPLRRGSAARESWAAKNVVGEHYQELAASGAFHRAERFEEVVSGSSAHSRSPTNLPRRGAGPSSR